MGVSATKEYVMENHRYTNAELNRILEDIDKGKYQGITKPAREFVGKDKDALSIPIKDGTERRVFERDNSGNWEEVG